MASCSSGKITSRRLSAQDAKRTREIMNSLEELARLIKARTVIDNQIAALLGRPAERGHTGEYIAAAIFSITLEKSAANKGSDGIFTAGLLAGRSVNIKWYGKHESVLDINPNGWPDYY